MTGHRSFMRGKPVALTLQHDMALMKRLKRASMSNRDRGGCLEFVGQQAIERGFGGFVERRGCLVEEQVLRLVQQRAGKAKPLLFAER